MGYSEYDPTFAERRAWNPARQTLRHAELRHDVLDATPMAGGAQKFPWAASLRISFSSVSSDTGFLSRSFSFSSSLSRFTWSDFKPPNSLLANDSR